MFKKIRPSYKKPVFPDTLAEMGYKFSDPDENGIRRLVLKETGESFEFEVKPEDKLYNQFHYEALIEVLSKELKRILVDECHLHKSKVPFDEDSKPGEERICIYHTPDALNNPAKLVILIPTSNRHVGQWTVRTMIDNLDQGSMIDYLNRARQSGFEVLITNPNENFVINGKHHIWISTNSPFQEIPHSGTPEEHVDYVLSKVLRRLNTTKIGVIAQGYGGYCLMEFLSKHFEECVDRIQAVALIDSSHSVDGITNDLIRGWLCQNCSNWVVSPEDLDVPVDDCHYGCICLSAGSDRENIASQIMGSVFKYLDNCLSHRLLEEEDCIGEDRMAEKGKMVV